ncbi:MAG: M23 family metallopeptidase [Gemmatimonadota bacterium]|nr:M23 family metallopeptidase [Gemmatimonadota bacterium]MDE3127253.1 M23 family metallopeptidase [Gemmatimonadota bacterium]MDE3174145.1 M23 family metallopeptidase [Gemmatimonadota bacterium]MDE3214947.1 M23 family metallopeptidase [Gemmatimonadota bacterium]
MFGFLRPPSRRHWTIVVVPPEPTGRTRTVRVHGHQVRAAAWLLAIGFVGYTGWSMAEALQVNASAAQLAEVHRLVLTLNDSLRLSNQRADSAFEIAAVTANVAHGPRLIARRAARPSTEVGFAASAAGVLLPVAGTITSRFSQSRWEPLLHLFRPHEGLDISAPQGTSIRAPADGRVTFVGRRLGYGLVVELDHGGGVTTLYAHCQKTLVHKGDYVAKGAAIATVGSTGLSTAPHVHFEVIVNGRHVDPMQYLIAPGEPPDSGPGSSYAAGDHDRE